jgi:hypothetical protein
MTPFFVFLCVPVVKKKKREMDDVKKSLAVLQKVKSLPWA